MSQGFQVRDALSPRGRLVPHMVIPVFGFPAGAEVKAAGIGNLGLQDRRSYLLLKLLGTNQARRVERQALRWVRQYISTFNGDPSKVTL